MSTKIKSSVIDTVTSKKPRKPAASRIGDAVAAFAALKAEEAALKHRLDEAADKLKDLLDQAALDECTVHHGGTAYKVAYKPTAGYPGTLVTAAMVGTYVGAKAAARPLVVRNIGPSEEA